MRVLIFTRSSFLLMKNIYLPMSEIKITGSLATDSNQVS